MTRGEAVNWIINISADIGKAEHSELWHYEQALLEIREMLESEPERKKGKWVKDEELSANYTEPIFLCSSCHNYEAWGWTECTNFCPNCGADMRGETNE